MSVVERALKRLQKGGGTPQSVTGQKPVARVSRRRAPPQSAVNRKAFEAIHAHGHVIEFSVEAMAEAGLYSKGNSQLADEYRMIKQPILRKATEESETQNSRCNLIMVASALGGEGKTFTSVNLSLSLASEKDWEVLLVDVDCRNPQLSRLLGVEKEPGIMDYLKDPSLDIESLIMPTSVDGLAVLPLGSIDEHAAEHLASARMDELCERFSAAGKHHIVVFDSSPLLLTSEAPILSTQIGQVALVVQANATPRQAVLEAIEKLDSERAIGLILNRADQGGDILRYGQGYGYGYPGR
jgi:exopolysaccharide/PEP-CTERM locus tyrosine autokinase